jgi:hypothetical protein
MQVLTVGFHYDFSVYANSTLGTSYKNVRLVSILDYQTALRFSNVPLQHRHIFPYLPQGTPSDATKYTYYLFRTATGQEVVLADVWIMDQTIVQTTGVNQTLVLRNITTGQLAIVRDQLRLLGISFDFL